MCDDFFFVVLCLFYVDVNDIVYSPAWECGNIKKEKEASGLVPVDGLHDSDVVMLSSGEYHITNESWIQLQK